MSRLRQTCLCLAAAVAVAVMAAHAQPALPVPGRISVAASNNYVAPPPMPQSPVKFFRQLLVMSPAERDQSLTNRTAAARTRILAKVDEYLALDPDEREARLRATELRWYLTPLMHLPSDRREHWLAQVPADMRDLVKSRLTQWDILPPPLQQEFLANDKTVHYFTAEPVSAANPQQQKAADRFSKWFELTPGEKQQMLGTLSDVDRAQMEKTLATFSQLPSQQREMCLRNFATFASMPGTERSEFLKNAENWSKMTPQERQTWQDLVAHVPSWPPLPPRKVPPLPPILSQSTPLSSKPNMATN